METVKYKWKAIHGRTQTSASTKHFVTVGILRMVSFEMSTVTATAKKISGLVGNPKPSWRVGLVNLTTSKFFKMSCKESRIPQLVEYTVQRF